MANTIGCKFGDVILVPFPFSDQTTTKKRPAVVVSSDSYHRDRSDVIMVAITSQTATPVARSGDVLIEQWLEAGLLKISMIKPVFATIENRLILRKLGALQQKDAGTLRNALKEVIG